MLDTLINLYENPEILSLTNEIDVSKIEVELGLMSSVFQNTKNEPKIRIAAYASLSSLIINLEANNIIRSFDQLEITENDKKNILQIYEKWEGLITFLKQSSSQIEIEDFFGYSTISMLAKKQTQLRSFLKNKSIRILLDNVYMKSKNLLWYDRVKSTISYSLLLLLRQENHNDVLEVKNIIDELANLQKEFEPHYLETVENSGKQIAALIALYHLADITIQMSQFLLVGSFIVNKEERRDILPELKKQIVRCEEFINLANDLDLIFWLNEITIILLNLRGDSIWIQGKGVSERIDKLLSELVSKGREKPVFSLLPSQQDALRKHLLDPFNIAVVLQMPTSSGKTLLAEFSIVQAMETYKNDARVAYVVPTRALVTQTQRTLMEDLGPLRIKISSAGSAFEEDPYELNLLNSTDGVVVSTPEKLDLLLRSQSAWFSKLSLIIIDEAHLLNDSERGLRLELLLANIRREHPTTRLLLLTPFIDNSSQIANWLGGQRGKNIDVYWRPSRLLIGLTKFIRENNKNNYIVELNDSDLKNEEIGKLKLFSDIKKKDFSSTSQKIEKLAIKLEPLGTVLTLFSSQKAQAENSAKKIAEEKDNLSEMELTPSLRVAIGLAYNDYGPFSKLAYCLERGVAFHHSSLSPILRYLVEDQIRTGKIKSVTATTTLAQGMNFPVATVLIHSVHKPYGKGNLSSSEFWNIAGRAGRVGLVDNGIIIFANENHEEIMKEYISSKNNYIYSVLLNLIHNISLEESLKSQYLKIDELRPLIQYLGHAAANLTPKKALDTIDELLQASLADTQIKSKQESSILYALSSKYLNEIIFKKRNQGYLKLADETGLGSFSFDYLISKISNVKSLKSGPEYILNNKTEGLYDLINVLKDLPDLSLAIGYGEGDMNVKAVSKVVEDWIDGVSIPKLANNFPGIDNDDKIRKAAQYLYSKVSQLISWGAHAYFRGWLFNSKVKDINPEYKMLGSYIQYGVKTPEAALVSLLGIPRPFAEPFGDLYRTNHGTIKPDDSIKLKKFVENAEVSVWEKVIDKSSVQNISPEDLRTVWRQMNGLY